MQEAGTYLATRWTGATTAVMLYHLGEVFAELHYDTEANVINGLRSFISSASLEKYAHYITLPEGLDELKGL